MDLKESYKKLVIFLALQAFTCSVWVFIAWINPPVFLQKYYILFLIPEIPVFVGCYKLYRLINRRA